MPIKPVEIAIRRMVNKSERFLPKLSPIYPKMMDPTGASMKLMENKPNVYSTEAILLCSGKKSEEKTGAK